MNDRDLLFFMKKVCIYVAQYKYSNFGHIMLKKKKENTLSWYRNIENGDETP